MAGVHARDVHRVATSRELNANLERARLRQGLAGDAFTTATAAAIDAFQSAHGLDPDRAACCSARSCSSPGPVRVTARDADARRHGAAGPVLSVTSTVRQVTIALDAAQQAEVKVGDPVTITLPDNSTTPGKVSYVGTRRDRPESDQGGGGGPSTPTIEVDVTPSDPAATGRLDQAPVDVSITTASVEDALVVPVNALLALAGGGYAVEEIGSGGAHRLVAVELGLFDDADGLVQVTGAGAGCRAARGGAGPMSAALARIGPETVLELEAVTKTYGSEPPVVALDGVSFSVQRRASSSRSSARRGRGSRRCCISWARSTARARARCA